MEVKTGNAVRREQEQGRVGDDRREQDRASGYGQKQEVKKVGQNPGEQVKLDRQGGEEHREEQRRLERGNS